MPNWCSGNIRLRGTGAAIRDFLKNELIAVGYEKCLSGKVSEQHLDIRDDGYLFILSLPENVQKWTFPSFYIKGTHRNFIDGKTIEIYLDKDENTTVCIDDIKAAWGFAPGPYIEKARKYGIDIKIVGFEMGMQVKQIIEIVGGTLTNFQEIEFEDWYWECEMPNMGG